MRPSLSISQSQQFPCQQFIKRQTVQLGDGWLYKSYVYKKSSCEKRVRPLKITGKLCGSLAIMLMPIIFSHPCRSHSSQLSVLSCNCKPQSWPMAGFGSFYLRMSMGLDCCQRTHNCII